MKKIKITIKEFDSILNMLDSDDKENKVVGLNTLNNLDFKSNLTMLFLLKKKANVSNELWTNNATKTYKKINNLIKISSGSADQSLTYKLLLKILIDNKQSESDIQFFLDNFAKHLFESIKNLGFDFIEDTEITIKLKQNDKQSRILSESI
jgi:hypothetical protein